MTPPRSVDAPALRSLNVDYEPHPGQLQFHQDRGVIDERAVFGGTGAGKTHGCGFEVSDITFREPPSTFIIAGPDFPQLEVSIYPTFEKLFGRPIDALAPLAKWNAQKKRLRWWNGWVWRFASMDDPRSVEGVPEAAGFWLNEARLLDGLFKPDGAYSQLDRRLRGSNTRRRYSILDTHSPTEELVDYYESQGHPGRRVYRWSTQQAVKWGTLDAAFAERQYARFHGKDRKRILRGLYAQAEGLVYDSFDPARHLRPWSGRPSAISVGVDLGWSHLMVATLHFWKGDSVHTVKEWVGLRVGRSTLEAQLREWRDQHGSFSVHVGTDVRTPETIERLKENGWEAHAYLGGVRDGIYQLGDRLQAGTWLIDPGSPDRPGWGCPRLLSGIKRYAWKKGSREEPSKGQDDEVDSARHGICGEGKKDRGFSMSA